MDSVLVTGAAGFVGHSLVRSLLAQGHRVVSIVRDWTRDRAGLAVVRGSVLDADLCRRVLADYEVDTVYHLAAQSIVSSCAEDPVTALEVAVLGTARLLQAVREARRPIRVVAMTSDKVYGHAPPPYSESTPFDARHAYEVSKACQDLTARMFFHNYAVDVMVVRAVNIYGPDDPNDTRLIPQTARRLLRGEPPLLHANAAAMLRQYVYIDDLIEALRIVRERGAAGDAYCVGSIDRPMSPLDVMREMATIAGVPFTLPEVRERDERFQEIAEQSVCDDKVRALGWQPRIPFAEGIRRTLAGYAEGRVK